MYTDQRNSNLDRPISPDPDNIKIFDQQSKGRNDVYEGGEATIFHTNSLKSAGSFERKYDEFLNRNSTRH